MAAGAKSDRAIKTARTTQIGLCRTYNTGFCALDIWIMPYNPFSVIGPNIRPSTAGAVGNFPFSMMYPSKPNASMTPMSKMLLLIA
ncbi:MAG: hypothetical protein WC712_15295, partial [Candidatus Brocadiia bacterium]